MRTKCCYIVIVYMHYKNIPQNTILGIFSLFWLCKLDQLAIRYHFNRVKLDYKFQKYHICHVELLSSLNIIMTFFLNNTIFKQHLVMLFVLY